MHFTYEHPRDHLKQGDLLRITDKLQGVLEDVHPHYANAEDYKYLMVLTPECDLVRRNGSCKSKYITLAAVRPLETLLYRELEKHQRSSLEKNFRLCDGKTRDYFRDYLIKLFNNNQQGYFYLAEEFELNISHPCVAFLALSIAIKVIHYDICLEARFAQLTNIFRAKLGWLIGEIYSRIGTPDWEDNIGKEEFYKLIDNELNTRAIWLDNYILASLKEEQRKRRKEFNNDKYCLSEKELYELIECYRKAGETKKRTQRAAELVTSIASEIITDLNEEQAIKLQYRLINNDEFEKLLISS